MLAMIILLSSLGCVRVGITEGEDIIPPAVDTKTTEDKVPAVDEMYNKKATREYKLRMPGVIALSDDEKKAIKNNGHVRKDLVLDAAFRHLEEGNPFVLRYNVITNSEVTPLLQYGIPYFFGGRNFNAVMERSPDYTLWKAWQDSLYYRDGVVYFNGLDCVGFMNAVRHQAKLVPLDTKRTKEGFNQHAIASGQKGDEDSFDAFKNSVHLGNFIFVYHPNLHVLIYIGTLRNYGYTELDFADNPEILDYPLVIHCGTNAAYADWFYHLKQVGLSRYKKATVPDGGVTVSIVGYQDTRYINTVRQQKQYTSWVQMPDDTWLTVLDWRQVDEWFVFR